jgi:peptidyl-prolyl cis-trans isomerase B (cyclophilin B)
MGIIQAGDPLSKDPAQKEKYGTGGLNALRFEPNAEKHTRGAVSAVLVPGKRDSAGSQFFICVADSHFLDWKYTAFGEVVSGMDVADKIAQVKRDGRDNPLERVEMTVTITE